MTLLDAPGHRDFVPNAIAGAAQSGRRVVVVDAAPGGFETGFAAGAGAGAGGGQTREHVKLAKSLGVERVVVAVSKMDACGTRGDDSTRSEPRFVAVSRDVRFRGGPGRVDARLGRGGR